VPDDEDIFAKFRRWLEKEQHEEHHHHHRHVAVLLGYINQGAIVMTEQILTVTDPPTVTVTAALGSVRDVNGNVVTDAVASGTWAVDDASVGSLAAATDGTLNAVVTLSGTAGTLNVTFSGLTASGAAITGAGQLVVTTGTTSSGAVSVDVTLSAV
jgi:hypothetical protein